MLHRQILNALFTITGIGLIPWRVRDSYNLAVVLSFARRFRKRQDRQLGAEETSRGHEKPHSDHNPVILPDQTDIEVATELPVKSWTRYERALVS